MAKSLNASEVMHLVVLVGLYSASFAAARISAKYIQLSETIFRVTFLQSHPIATNVFYQST